MTGKLLADIFQDGMVLPIHKDFRLGGQAASGAAVTVSFLGEAYQVQANEQGHWQVTLPACDQQELAKITVASGGQTQCLRGLHFGRVLLLSGQSNIEYRLKDDAEFAQVKADLAAGHHPNLYYYNCPQIDYRDPETGTVKPAVAEEKWQEVTVETAGEMSAIGYYCLAKLQEADPSQIYAAIDCFKGGTSASNWLPVDLLKDDPELQSAFIDPYEAAIKGKSWADFDRETAKWQAAVDQHNVDLKQYLDQHPESSLSQAKNIVGHTPWPPPMRPDSYLRPGALYETMVSQIQDVTVTDWVWYQGENDTDRPRYYSKLLNLLLKTWRRLLADPSLPVKLIQLPGYADNPENSVALIRQTQLETARKSSYVDLVSIADLGEAHNIHPTHKRSAGERLAVCMSGASYPATPTAVAFKKDAGRLRFKVANSFQLQVTGEVKVSFQTAGQTWLPDQAVKVQISGQKVSLPCPDDATGLRYGYANYPDLAIYNELGAPLAPFETVFSENSKVNLK